MSTIELDNAQKGSADASTVSTVVTHLARSAKFALCQQYCMTAIHTFNMFVLAKGS